MKEKVRKKLHKDFRVEIEKITGISLMQWACSMTIDADTDISLDKIYTCEHSPMRTQLFKISLFNIPTFVSGHLVRHPLGIDHFCKSNREDRSSSSGDTGRMHPTNHGMVANAQGLINMARKRLCFKSHYLTREVMLKIWEEILHIDYDLAHRMEPECIYRGGICYEDKPCGNMTLKGWFNDKAL